MATWHFAAFKKKLEEDFLRQNELEAVAIDDCSVHSEEFLTTPHAFYTRLLSMIDAARQSIFISTLYVGSGDRETEIVRRIAAALSLHRQLRATFVLDATRGARPAAECSTSLIEGLRREFGGDRVRLLLFTPPAARSLFARCFRGPLVEALGVHHAKFYAADDSMLISGYFLSSIDLLLAPILPMRILRGALIGIFFVAGPRPKDIRFCAVWRTQSKQWLAAIARRSEFPSFCRCLCQSRCCCFPLFSWEVRGKSMLLTIANYFAGCCLFRGNL